MKKIVLKMKYRCRDANIRKDILKTLVDEFEKTGVLLLPDFVDLVTVIDNDCELELEEKLLRKESDIL